MQKFTINTRFRVNGSVGRPAHGGIRSGGEAGSAGWGKRKFPWRRRLIAPWEFPFSFIHVTAGMVCPQCLSFRIKPAGSFGEVDQYILHLCIVFQYHLMGFPANAGFFIAAKW